jgi:hypothetical protein
MAFAEEAVDEVDLEIRGLHGPLIQVVLVRCPGRKLRLL